MAEHYAGDDTNVRTLAGGILAAYDGISVEDFEAQSDASCAAPSIRRSAAGTSSAPTRRWSSCSATWRRTGSRTTSPPAAVATSCGRSARTCTASPASGSSAAAARFAYTSDEHGGTITHKPEADYLDDGPEKPVRIWNRTGRRPLLAAGNSNGDIPMLEFTQHADKPTLRLLVLHDDGEREFDYTAGAEQALEQAGADGWTVVSMKNDWTTVFL